MCRNKYIYICVQTFTPFFSSAVQTSCIRLKKFGNQKRVSCYFFFEGPNNLSSRQAGIQAIPLCFPGPRQAGVNWASSTLRTQKGFDKFLLTSSGFALVRFWLSWPIFGLSWPFLGCFHVPLTCSFELAQAYGWRTGN